MPAQRARSRSHINKVVSRPNGVLVVFDYQHRVAQCLEAGQRTQQSLIVTLVQTDGRLV